MAGATKYAKSMANLSARIFGELTRPTDQTSMRVVKLFSELPQGLRPVVYDYYPQHIEYHNLMRTLRDEHEDFKEEMKRLRKLRGKEKPKKGEGKRALARK
uniref:Small ribosomal subunit protein mS33 n=1 Tax=Eptatretus burgeri TaxID=7764 RepID=A0A8C4WYH4_EPTBU